MNAQPSHWSAELPRPPKGEQRKPITPAEALSPMSNNAFISYAHVDEKRLERLHKHLVMLRRDGSLQAWSDHAIIPGDNIGQTISAALAQSSLVIALISPDYLASNYCYEKELQRALQLQAEGRLRIVAVILEPCDWLNSPFSEILVLPKSPSEKSG